MNETFFAHLEESTLRELLARSALQDAALITVGPSLHIENCNEAARQLLGLRPLERIDQLLSEAAAGALRSCIAGGQPCTIYEELDGVTYVRWDDAPYSLADRGAFLGLATDGEQEFCLYAVKGDEEESCIYCFWDWEGFFYRKA